MLFVTVLVVSPVFSAVLSHGGGRGVSRRLLADRPHPSFGHPSWLRRHQTVSSSVW